MSTITKEWLQQKIADMESARDEIPFGLGEDGTNTLAALRIALASLEAEPYGYVHKAAYEQAGSCGLSGDHEAYRDSSTHIAVYTAPPAPVSVPAAMEMDDDFDSAFEHGKAVGWNACRSAMLKHSESFIVTSDHRMMEMPQVEAINAVTAMLQGVENAETPTTMQTASALDSSPKIAELPSGNSPVIPDGWVMVPEDPTHEMLEAGDEQFGTYDVYRRMIEAAPKLE